MPVFKTEHDDALHTSWRGGFRGCGIGRDSRCRGYGTYCAAAYTGGVGNYGSEGVQKSNPISKNGKVMRFFHYISPRHFFRFSTQSQDDSGREEIHIGMLNSDLKGLH